MKYLRVTIYALLFVVAIVFIQQNLQDFSAGVTIRLNLYFFSFESMSIPIYVMFLMSFFVGVVIASFYGLMDRIRLKSRLRAERKEVSHLKKELESARGVAAPEPESRLEPQPEPEPYFEQSKEETPPALEMDTEPEKNRKDE